MFNKLKDNSGAALLIALSVLAMLTLVAIMSVDRAATDIDLSYNQLHEEQAFYMAEAGANRAVAELNSDLTWTAGFAGEGLGNGTYSVLVTDSFTVPTLVDTIILTATGTALEARAQVEYTVVPEVVYPFSHALFARDAVDIRNSMITDSYNSDSGSYAATHDTTGGSIGSNGIITVYNGAYIGGDVATSLDTGLFIDPGATVTGTISNDAPETELDLIPDSEYDSARINNTAPAGLSGSYTYNSTTGDLTVSSGNLELADGIYYFSSFILKNSASMTLAPGAKVTIYVTGNVEIKNSGGVNVGGVPSDLMFYSQGDIVLKNSGDCYGVFYTPNGSADLRNTADFFGAIVAADMIGHNSSKFHYDRNLADRYERRTGKVELVAWREL
ncbi:MAG: hypothetical protein OEW00_04360 [candidate division Zixibacteria bacterium]|nr:hypothetical protein [candidate division Zixibacteria bacterium]